MDISLLNKVALTNGKLFEAGAMHTARECQFCFSPAVGAQDDGSYICRVCHAVQESRETFDEIENLPVGEPRVVRSFRISQRVSKENRVSLIILTDGMQLILPFQSIAGESRVGIPLSDSIFSFLVKFPSIIAPLLKEQSFSRLVLILLSRITEIGS
jgi:hypothetical protein